MNVMNDFNIMNDFNLKAVLFLININVYWVLWCNIKSR